MLPKSGALRAACLLGGLGLCLGAVAESRPSGGALKFPYYDWGACPFECCTDQQWTANTATVIRRGRSRTSPEVFRVQKGENVQGLTAVVITRRPGRVKALQYARLVGEAPAEAPGILKPGDVLHVLRYSGEGYYLVWFKGVFRTARLRDADKIGVHEDFEVLSVPDVAWWVKVKNGKGQVGWTDETHHFDHIDACE